MPFAELRRWRAVPGSNVKKPTPGHRLPGHEAAVAPLNPYFPRSPLNWHDDCFDRGGPVPIFVFEHRLAGILEADMSVGESLFGIHGTALELRSQRMSMLASNIANAATPNYKARDMDFAQALRKASDGESIESAIEYRVPLQPSLDGNTVEMSTEQTAFAENALAYRSSLSFLQGRVGTMMRALKGE